MAKLGTTAFAPPAHAQQRGDRRVRAVEDDCRDALAQIAKLFGWHVHAQRSARDKRGNYSSAIVGHQGFPDLVLARGRHLWFVELKRYPNLVEPAQEIWLEILGEDRDDAISNGPIRLARRRPRSIAAFVVWVPEEQQAFADQLRSDSPDHRPFSNRTERA